MDRIYRKLCTLSSFFLRNFNRLNTCQQLETILHAALNLAIANQTKRGEFVKQFDHFKLLNPVIN
jgi:hypothetical protein